MATGTAGNAARIQARQVVNTWREQINWNDPENGSVRARIVIPMGAFICGVFVEIVTAFDGSAALLIGSTGSYNQVVAAGDVDEAVAGVYEATRSYGRSVASAADTTIYTKLTSTGGTVGQAEVLMIYEGNTG